MVPNGTLKQLEIRQTAMAPICIFSSNLQSKINTIHLDIHMGKDIQIYY